MRLIDKKLYISFKQMVECGVSENYLKKAKSTGTKCWHFIDDPDDKRAVLIDYEELKDNYKEMVKQRFGNPYDMVARLPILNMIIQDPKANEYYKLFRYDDNKYLPIGTVNKYTRAASWLNMLDKVQTDRQVIKKVLGLSVPEFYLHAGTLINIEKENAKSGTYTGLHVLPGDFPSSYQRLMNKVNGYKEAGSYDYLIAPEYGNKKASKIGMTADGYDEDIKEKQIAVIRRIAALHTNFNATQVKTFADVIFNKEGWNCIGEGRIYQIMQEYAVQLTPGRRGRRAYNSEMSMQMKREAPKYPTYYWTLDGWTAELLYQEGSNYNGRMVVVVVLDAMNKYPVGFAIGDRENAELIREANRNALQHIKELFNGNYCPYQVQSDRYAVKQLTPFYQAMSHLFTPAAVGNAKSKIIEPYFKYLNTTYCQTKPNWSGHNITASKKNQVNSEMLNLIKSSFPDKAGVIRQIENMIMAERKLKLAEYIQGWDAMPIENRTVMSDMDRIMVCGKPIGDTNRIEGQGILKVIGDAKYAFDCFDPAFRQKRHIDWQIIADEQDLSKVVAINGDGTLKFVLEQKMCVAMDILSTTDEHIDYQKRVRGYNKERVDEIIDMYSKDAAIVNGILAQNPLQLDDENEAALKLMLTYGGQQKERLQDAKGLKNKEVKHLPPVNKVPDDWQQRQQEYLTNKTDFNKYMD